MSRLSHQQTQAEVPEPDGTHAESRLVHAVMTKPDKPNHARKSAATRTADRRPGPSIGPRLPHRDAAAQARMGTMIEMASLVLFAADPEAAAAFYRALGVEFEDEHHGE